LLSKYIRLRCFILVIEFERDACRKSVWQTIKPVQIGIVGIYGSEWVETRLWLCLRIWWKMTCPWLVVSLVFHFKIAEQGQGCRHGSK